MKFVIVFEYMDGEIFHLDVHKDDIEEFVKCFGKGEVYFNPSRGVGLWIPVEKIRHFKVECVDSNGKRIVKEEKVPCGAGVGYAPVEGSYEDRQSKGEVF